jgi:hypothetical protein
VGKKAGKVELAWYRLQEAAPWGHIVGFGLLIFFVGYTLAAVTGIVPVKFGPDGGCGPRGMTLADDC